MVETCLLLKSVYMNAQLLLVQWQFLLLSLQHHWVFSFLWQQLIWLGLRYIYQNHKYVSRHNFDNNMHLFYTDQTSAWYYRPQIISINCSALLVSCTKSENVNENSTCIVYYHGADSQYEQILTTKRFSKDETTKILLLESIETTIHYLAFHLNVSNNFEINDQFTHSISDFSCLQGIVESFSLSMAIMYICTLQITQMKKAQTVQTPLLLLLGYH